MMPGVRREVIARGVVGKSAVQVPRSCCAVPGGKWRSAVDVDVGCKNSVGVREAYDSRERRGSDA